MNAKIEENINCNQFDGMGGASTTDALVEMIYIWSEATDKLDHYVRVALLDFSKAFDLINRNTLLVKLKQYDLPPHIPRWIVTFLLDRSQQVKIEFFVLHLFANTACLFHMYQADGYRRCVIF